MKKAKILIIIFWIFFFNIFLTSCHFRKDVKLHIKNLSHSRIDSLKIVLENSETTYFSKLEPDEEIELKMSHTGTSATAGGNIFEIYYAQNGSLYMANFGYHTGNVDIKPVYSVFIFPKGIGENQNESPPLNDNKVRVADWP